MLRHLRHIVFVVSLAFVAGLAHEAHAGDAAAAQALFDQAKKLMGEKRYSEACAKFEESQKQDPGLGTQTNLAICYESLGRTASAWSLYLDVASQAKATNQTEREKKARDAAKALEPKLSKLTVQVLSPAKLIEVRRNGEIVSQAMWGTAIPVDPGLIKLTATAPDRSSWEKSLTVDKPGETVVTVPELEKGKPAAGYYPTDTPTGTTTNPAPTGTTTNPAPTSTSTGPVYYNPNGNTSYQPPGGLPPAKPAMKRRSGGLFGGGIAMVSVGGVTTLIGLAWTLVSSFDYEGPPPAAFGTLGIGLALVAGGSVMIAVGNKKVPVDPNEASVPKPSLVPEVRLGLTGANAKWVF
ncbi:MAG: hypothetical protein U0441_04095 [Polyangiaceae bacterium]